MKAGTLVAAWKIGGYCCVRTSHNSGEPYFGRCTTEAVEVCGVYKKLTSRPVMGFRRGGRKVDGVCGMENVRCSIWCPIRAKASRREGRVRELGVKVKRVLLKSVGDVSSQHSDDVSRKAQMVDMSRFAMRVERIPSSRQRRRNIGLAEAITCACRSRMG